MKKTFAWLSFLILFSFAQNIAWAQAAPDTSDIGIDEDDISLSGDIFTDFNEELDASKITEDERYYAYGRFFSFNIGLGLTTFNGNRGVVYENDPPTYGVALHYFMDFHSAFGLGLEYSKHHFFIEQPVHAYNPDPPGLIEVSMLRTFFSYRYYIDTANLGTAITYSNPYLTSRLEYWYTTNKFIDQSELPNKSGGGLGFGLGGGLEFPIAFRESYINIEFLYHTVNYFDKYTQDYRPTSTNPNGFGYDDLTGDAFSTMVYYVLGW